MAADPQTTIARRQTALRDVFPVCWNVIVLRPIALGWIMTPAILHRNDLVRDRGWPVSEQCVTPHLSDEISTYPLLASRKSRTTSGHDATISTRGQRGSFSGDQVR